jgi:hypothetical protein
MGNDFVQIWLDLIILWDFFGFFMRFFGFLSDYLEIDLLSLVLIALIWLITLYQRILIVCIATKSWYILPNNS